MSAELSVTLIHGLPGRLRLRLSAAPRDVQGFLAAVTAHEGLGDVRYTPITRSLLIRYETGHLTTEEILLRTAMACSFDHDHVPVVILPDPESEVMTDASILAGLLLLVAALARWSALGGPNSLLEKGAGVGVALAVLQHGWREAREKNTIDPELLTLGYLFTAFTRSKPLRGAAVTWAASFGRHLLQESARGVEVRPMAGSGGTGAPQAYQITPMQHRPRHTPLLAATQAVLRSMGLILGDSGGNTLLEELRNVALTHDRVLEGLGGMHRGGIPLIFR